MIFQPARASGKSFIIEMLEKYRINVGDYVISLAVVSIGKDAEELNKYLLSCENLQKQSLLNIIEIYGSWEWSEGIIIALKEIERRGFAESSAERFDL